LYFAPLCEAGWDPVANRISASVKSPATLFENLFSTPLARVREQRGLAPSTVQYYA